MKPKLEGRKKQAPGSLHAKGVFRIEEHETRTSPTRTLQKNTIKVKESGRDKTENNNNNTRCQEA
jgi:hypothetical protein